MFVGEIVECRSIRSGEVRHDQHGPHFLERTQIVGQLRRFIHVEPQPGHAGVEFDGNRQRLRPSRQMALRKDPLKAFPAMDQRRDVVARGKSRIFIPCQSHQGARIAFERVKELTANLATVETSAYRLAESIKKTQKRANALKNITIPSYQALVKDISNALEEKDREEFTRLKVIKRSTTK